MNVLSFSLVLFYGICLLSFDKLLAESSACNERCYIVRICTSRVLLCNKTLEYEKITEISCIEERNILRIGSNDPVAAQFIHPLTWPNVVNKNVKVILLGTPLSYITRHSLSTIPEQVSTIILDGNNLKQVDRFIFEEKSISPLFFLNPNMSSLAPANYSKLQAKKQLLCKRQGNKCFCVDETSLGNKIKKFKFYYVMNRIFNCERKPICKDCTIDYDYSTFIETLQTMKKSSIKSTTNYCKSAFLVSYSKIYTTLIVSLIMVTITYL